MDNALKIHPVDNAIIFTNSYPLDSDLSGSLHNRRNTYFFCGFRKSEGKSEEGEEYQTRAALAFVRLKKRATIMLVNQAILSGG